MARMLGLNDVAEKYAVIAKKMAVKWEKWRMRVIITVWLLTERTLGVKNITWFGISCGT